MRSEYRIMSGAVHNQKTDRVYLPGSGNKTLHHFYSVNIWLFAHSQSFITYWILWITTYIFRFWYSTMKTWQWSRFCSISSNKNLFHSQVNHQKPCLSTFPKPSKSSHYLRSVVVSFLSNSLVRRKDFFLFWISESIIRWNWGDYGAGKLCEMN